MKISRLVLAIIVLGLMSLPLKADGIGDPQAKLVGGSGSTGLFTLTDPNFTGTVFGTGCTYSNSCVNQFDFINITGVLVGEVDLAVTDLSSIALTFTVDPNNPYFTSASPTSPTTITPGETIILSFFGTDADHGGLPFTTNYTCSEEESEGGPSCTDLSGNGSDFGVQFHTSDLQNSGLNPDSPTFSFQGTLVAATPEPSTVMLFLAGTGLLLLLKRLW